LSRNRGNGRRKNKITKQQENYTENEKKVPAQDYRNGCALFAARCMKSGFSDPFTGSGDAKPAPPWKTWV
jgi:hypothetical protein